MLATSVPAKVTATPDGRIQGRVVDRTAPQHPVAAQAVRLTIIERGASSDQDAMSDAAGEFHFAGLPLGGIRLFVLSTEYRGVRYVSDRVVLAPDASRRTVDLVVFEASSNRAALRGTVAFAVVDVARGAARLSVIQGFANPTDRTIVTVPDDPLVFPLPAGANAVTALEGWREPHIAPGRITDTLAVLPGEAHVAYAYRVDARGSPLVVPWPLPYGASDVEVLVADLGVALSADGLTARGAVTGPKGHYRRWSGGPIAAGGSVRLLIRGVPPAGDPWPPAVAAGLAAALAGGLIIALRRAGRARA